MRDLRSSLPDSRESQRLRLLQRLCLSGSFDFGCLDDIARIAALALEMPVASILAADVDGPWILSAHGGAFPDLPLDALFGEPTAAGLVVIEDARGDARFAGLSPSPGFFAASAFSSAGGTMVALCIMDRRPRHIDERAAGLLRGMAGCARYAIESTRREAARLETAGASLISPAAHAIRGALTSIRGFSEFLLSQDSTEDVRRELLGFVHDKADQSASVVSELVELYRLETAGGSDFQHSSLSLATLLSGALEAYSGHLELNIEENLPPIQADARRLERALANLLQYVADGASSQNGIAVGLSRAEEPGFLAITVEAPWNAGRSGELRSLSEPFFRAEHAESSGLAVTQKIVTLHGGRFRVARSDPGRLCVALLLPI